MRKLTFKAPRRCSLEDGTGHYSTKVWTLGEVLLYIFTAGGYFVKGGHDFDCATTAEIATDPKTYKEVDYA